MPANFQIASRTALTVFYCSKTMIVIKSVPKWSLKGVQIAFGVEVVCGESFWEPREGVGRAFWLFGVPQMAHWDPKGAKSYLQEPSKREPCFAPLSEVPLESTPWPNSSGRTPHIHRFT